jgi:uncharacterized protein YraI
MTRIRRVALAAALGGLLAGGLLAVPAAAEPDTPVLVKTGASATRAGGRAFDTCVAPNLAAITAWEASPYRTVNVYFGGNNRACPTQPNLTPSWVTTIAKRGWRILPTYLGYQPACTRSTKTHRYTTTAQALSTGAADAQDAVNRAQALGLRPGSALYADVEHYDVAASGCATTVRAYVSAWTKKLHQLGYLSGVYVHQDSGALHLAQSYSSTSYARPDAIWIARWDGVASLTGWPTVPNSLWPVNQRIKQYEGNVRETWGGVTITIDRNVIAAPVATVLMAYQVTSSTPLNARSGPSTGFSVVRTYAPRSTVQVVCQIPGQTVGSTNLWARLSDGSFVADHYLSTPTSTKLPRCTYPGQVTATGGLNARTGPGAQYALSGAKLPYGALAYVSCQKAGSRVSTTSVWNRLEDGRWVSDYYVSNASNTTFSARVARCA